MGQSRFSGKLWLTFSPFSSSTFAICSFPFKIDIYRGEWDSYHPLCCKYNMENGSTALLPNDNHPKCSLYFEWSLLRYYAHSGTALHHHHKKKKNRPCRESNLHAEPLSDLKSIALSTQPRGQLCELFKASPFF